MFVCVRVFFSFLHPLALPLHPSPTLQEADAEAAADERFRLSGPFSANAGLSAKYEASTAAAAAAVAAPTGAAAVGGGEAGGGGGGAQGAPGARTISSFSRPSRAVVTFALFLSAPTAGLPGSSHEKRLWQKRLYEVEALEHNTLQGVMGE